MKLIIQIPCYNEAESLPATLADLPESLPGISVIETLVIDDGSTDTTSEVARRCGVDHVFRLKMHRGLATAFSRGLSHALELGADIIVNTDADNQYAASSISDLIQPVLDGEADIVIGTRPIREHTEFSFLKKQLQHLGSAVVRLLSGTRVEDAPSGFRAMSARAARQLHIFSPYTYTLEMILQAGVKGIATTSVEVDVNPATRPSRLMSSIPQYLFRSLVTLIDITLLYRARRVFSLCALVLALTAFLISSRFLYFYVTEGGSGKVQSLILASILFGAGVTFFITGLLANLISTNRILLEKNAERLRAVESDLSKIAVLLKARGE